jgi:hypothetical protein
MGIKTWNYNIPDEITLEKMISTASKELHAAIEEIEDQSYFIIQVVPILTFNTGATVSKHIGNASVILSAQIIYK